MLKSDLDTDEDGKPDLLYVFVWVHINQTTFLFSLYSRSIQWQDYCLTKTKPTM